MTTVLEKLRALSQGEKRRCPVAWFRIHSLFALRERRAGRECGMCSHVQTAKTAQENSPRPTQPDQASAAAHRGFRDWKWAVSMNPSVLQTVVREASVSSSYATKEILL